MIRLDPEPTAGRTDRLDRRRVLAVFLLGCVLTIVCILTIKDRDEHGLNFVLEDTGVILTPQNRRA